MTTPSIAQLMTIVLGLKPGEDPSCEACRAGDDKPVPPEILKERTRIEAIEMDARDNIEGRVIDALHLALLDNKTVLIDIEHNKNRLTEGNPEVHRARIAYAEQLLALFTAKRQARDAARPKQATEGVSPVGRSDTQSA